MACATLLVTACGGTREAQPFDHLAQCLSNQGVVMYGADTCPHCKAQKAEFKGSFDLINYVECAQNPLKCQQAGVSAYPTWKFADGTLDPGRKSLSALAEKAGCELKAPGPSNDAVEDAERAESAEDLDTE